MESTQHDTIELAEQTKRAYGEHYVGAGKPRVLKDIVDRYHGALEDESFDDALTSFMRTRGPYLQALDLPREGPSWEAFAEEVDLDEDIVRTFREAGFENLYEFQATTIRRILEGDHTLVTAGTGRGKTESWLIPILQYICEAKAGEHPTHPAQSVKCVLTYPTKALAQDQLKRLIEYLFELNRHRSGTDQITVGIYDGDTPNDDPDEYDYLNTAYKFFECPCDECDASLTVERTEDERFRVTHDASGVPDPELGFIKLTREDVVDEQVDILLTNPDTVNYRLFNINEEDEQTVFISQPKHIVFDEIHEYSELFGAFTTALMRRYVRSRRELLGLADQSDDDLQIIGASATVENRRTIFNRINPFTDPSVSVVAEDPQTIDVPFPDSVPDVYTSSILDEAALVNAVAGDGSPGPVGTALLDLIPSRDLPKDATDARSRLQSALYTKLLEDESDDLDFVRALYADLHETPKEPTQLVEVIESEFDLETEAAETLLSNFAAIGRLSGVLESRAHLFSWPIDGYYTCLNCATVYDTPQAVCSECDHTFVTKLSYCKHCGEEALESWFCPSCERLEPLAVTSPEGRFEYFQTQTCKCDTEMIRTVWRPFYECDGCGERQKIDRVRTCPDCDDGTPLSLSTDRDRFECTNPDCDTTLDSEDSISCRCCDEDDLKPLSDDVLYCDECGETYDDETGQHCTCGGALTPKRFLGWQCSDEACDEVYLGEPPRTCECGKRRFARTALFDVNRVEHCSSCDRDLFPEQDCFCDEPDTNAVVRGFTHYKQVDERGQIRSPTDFPGAVPCYDRGKTYGKSDRYESMLRGPGNTAVTTSQYLLRFIADRSDPESFTRAKLLSFADSQSDMKELTRDFNEPEETLFFSQLVVEQLEAADGCWAPLAELQQGVWEAAQEYEVELQSEIDTGSEPILGSLTTYDTSTRQYVYDEVAARILRGQFNNRRASFLRLPNDGLVNVRLEADFDELGGPKREIIGALHTQSKRYLSTLAEDIDGAGHHIDELVEAGILEKESTDNGILVGLNPDSVSCALVSDETPIAFNPVEERFYTEFDLVCSDVDSNLVEFTADYESRSDVAHPHFTLTAYRLMASEPMMLLGKSYFGATERTERRRLEYQFREGRYPHYLSSGPAMELGVDIGDLDSLLLYGTPPNANSYLQRVGRAGRRSGSSLVHSVSKRNPIDYYYFERPSELIQSDAQPVPLNETNEEVLARSLTWALLDFVAATFWLPWRREASALQDAFIYDADEGFTPRGEAPPNDIVSFGTLLASACIQLQPGADVSPLEGIRDAIDENRERAREWLRDLLRFSACERCGRKHEAGYEGPCNDENCEGTTVSALGEFDHVVDQAFDVFHTELVDAYIEFEDELFEELDQIEDEISELRRSSRGRRRRRGDQEDTNEREQLERLRNRRTQLDRYHQRLEDQSFGDFLSLHSNADFNLRSVSDKVTYELIGDDFEPRTQDPLDRNVQMALKELHPGAAYLHSDYQTYVVTELIEDEYETARLREQIPDEAICLTCGTTYDIDVGACEGCGRELKRLQTVAPNRVRAYKSDLPLETLSDGDPLTPSRVYRNPTVPVQSTYAPVDTEIVDFTPHEKRSYAIVDENDERLGTFSHGSMRLRSSATEFYATYKSGGSDPLPTVFELCGNDNCNGVIARDSDNAYCTRHPEHDVGNSVAVRLSNEFETKGVRVQLASEELEHTVVHGLRVALQYIGGVGVRQVPETIEDDGTYVYDGDEGGSGITVLLTEGAGEEDGKFQRALEIIAETFECECDNGCPFCVYQYGCTDRNDPHSFDKDAFESLVDRGLRLVPNASIADEGNDE